MFSKMLSLDLKRCSACKNILNKSFVTLWHCCLDSPRKKCSININSRQLFWEFLCSSFIFLLWNSSIFFPPFVPNSLSGEPGADVDTCSGWMMVCNHVDFLKSALGCTRNLSRHSSRCLLFSETSSLLFAKSPRCLPTRSGRRLDGASSASDSSCRSFFF